MLDEAVADVHHALPVEAKDIVDGVEGVDAVVDVETKHVVHHALGRVPAEFSPIGLAEGGGAESAREGTTAAGEQVAPPYGAEARHMNRPHPVAIEMEPRRVDGRQRVAVVDLSLRAGADDAPVRAQGGAVLYGSLTPAGQQVGDGPGVLAEQHPGDGRACVEQVLGLLGRVLTHAPDLEVRQPVEAGAGDLSGVGHRGGHGVDEQQVRPEVDQVANEAFAVQAARRGGPPPSRSSPPRERCPSRRASRRATSDRAGDCSGRWPRVRSGGRPLGVDQRRRDRGTMCSWGVSQGNRASGAE